MMRSARPADSTMRLRRWCGVLTSCAVHGIAVVVLANIINFGRTRELSYLITSVWQHENLIEPLDSPTLELPKALNASPNAGGAGFHGDLDEPASQWLATGELPALDVDFDLSVSAGASPTSVATGNAQRTGKGQKATGGSGTGTGTGVGSDSGPGFFGMVPPDASRVVFVVDNSRSMNHPHESELKTRFRRVKFELLKCIAEMQPTQSFYVIFFSNEMLPMPATALQPAQPGYREPYLQWIGQSASGGGPTDPRDALTLALRMQPDVICFLTDGEFPKGVSRQLMSLKQNRTAIHTFAFGDTLGEETLKAMAQNNHGEYRFVP